MLGGLLMILSLGSLPPSCLGRHLQRSKVNVVVLNSPIKFFKICRSDSTLIQIKKIKTDFYFKFVKTTHIGSVALFTDDFNE